MTESVVAFRPTYGGSWHWLARRLDFELIALCNLHTAEVVAETSDDPAAVTCRRCRDAMESPEPDGDR